VFAARYGLSPYIPQMHFVFKRLSYNRDIRVACINMVNFN
jgi:hypothetical protein